MANTSIVEHPILFSAPMVRAILEGRKTQTRRVVKLPNGDWHLRSSSIDENGAVTFGDVAATAFDQVLDRVAARYPYGVPGDRLWVKETFSEYSAVRHSDRLKDIVYRADIPEQEPPFKMVDGQKVLTSERIDWIVGQRVKRWKPSIFMPRWASRITLEIEDVRVQRLQEISEEDAISEGIEQIVSMGTYHTWKNYAPGLPAHVTALESYRTLWNSINLKPKPIEERDADGKKRIVGYISYPWCTEDFDVVYPGALEAGLYLGKPLTVCANPFVWALTFKSVEVARG